MRHQILVANIFVTVGFSVALAAQGTTLLDQVASALSAGHPVGKPLVFTETWDTEPVAFDVLAAYAELIVEGKLTRLKSYLSENKAYIFTDYQLTPKQMIIDRKGILTAKAQGTPRPLIVTVYGGELVMDGTPVRHEISSHGKWDQNADLLVFLARSQHDPTKYRLYSDAAGLFQVEPGTQRVKSLLNHWDKDREVKDKSFDQIVQKIQAIAKK
jgi:hypothetical protein